MHFLYVDDSGDETIRVFSAIAVDVELWNECFAQILEFRRALRDKQGIYVTVELHATELVSGHGRISPNTIPKGARCRIFEEMLGEITTLPGVHIFNAADRRNQEAKLFERLLNRINRTMQEWKSRALIISDEGKDFTYLVRKMRVHNPVGSMFGYWEDGNLTKNILLDRIIEDVVFRKSHRSYFIQAADFCAYALLRSENPLPSKSKYGLHKSFDILAPICTPQCFSKDPRKLGIIRAI